MKLDKEDRWSSEPINLVKDVANQSTVFVKECKRQVDVKLSTAAAEQEEKL
jgi:hypothetical protein